MRGSALLPALVLGLALTYPANAKSILVVRAVSHETQAFQRTSTYTTPGTSNTNCSGSASTIGSTTTGTANCQTQSTPAQTHQITANSLDVRNIVEANGMRYIIDGDSFNAELDGTTMWVEARRGGNQGKKIRIKYKILDIRPAPTPEPLIVETVPVAPVRKPEVGEPLDNAGVVNMVKAGLKEDVIVYLIGLRPASYSLTAKDRDELRNAAVPSSVIQAMSDKMSGR
jgi:hypothetical protein